MLAHLDMSHLDHCGEGVDGKIENESRLQRIISKILKDSSCVSAAPISVHSRTMIDVFVSLTID